MEEISLVFTADSFLQRMVRNMVGVLVRVGTGRLQPADMPALLALRDRRKVKVDPAPPQGLYLVDVYY